MAKKPKTRPTTSAASRRAVTSPPPLPWWRHKFFWGSCTLLLVLGLGVFVRYVLFRPVLPHLQGAVEQHYTRGPAGAAVILQEFSDYT